jgi:hypothetical protein
MCGICGIYHLSGGLDSSAVACLAASLPSSTSMLSATGFEKPPIPLHEWYQKGPVRDFVREISLSGRAKSRGLLRVDRIEPLLDSERAYDRVIRGLLSLELWMEVYVDGKSPVTS